MPEDLEFSEAVLERALEPCWSRELEGSAGRFRELCEKDKSFSELVILLLNDIWMLLSLLFEACAVVELGGEGDHPEITSESGSSSSTFCDLLEDQSRFTAPRPDRTCEDAPDLDLRKLTPNIRSKEQ